MLHDPIFLFKNHSLSLSLKNLQLPSNELGFITLFACFTNYSFFPWKILRSKVCYDHVVRLLWDVFKSDCHARLPAILMYSFMSCRVPKAACETTRLGHAAEHCIRECSRCKLLASRLHPPHYSSRHQNQQHSAR